MGLLVPPPLRFGPPSTPIKKKQTGPQTTPIKLPVKRKATTTSSSIAKCRRSTTSQPLARKLTFTRSTSQKKKPARKSVSSRSTSKKTEKQPLARKALSKESLKTFDGQVSEAEHVMRHAGCQRFCIRCDTHQRAKLYEAWSWHDGQSWLKRGVDSRGVWGLGCSVCAKFSKRGTSCHARFSKFAKFEFRETACRFRVKFLIEQHQKSLSHRMAYQGVTKERLNATPPPPPLPQPLACPPTTCDDQVVEATAEDINILQGNVPSPAEWKDAWATVSETMSLRKEARVFVKKFSGEAFMLNRRRKRLRKQLVVMAEVLRRQIRNVFRQATSISLAMDECKYRKIIRFRADLPVALSTELRHVGASGFSLSGVLGILDCSKKHAADFEEDHAVTALKQLDGFLVKFCTPLGRAGGQAQPLACDEELRNKLLRAVTCIAADGASKERRAILLAARELFPNVVIVIRDPAHAIRISCFKALHCDDVFQNVWHELFDGRHALVPDLMNSDKWHNLLTAIQEDNVRAVAMPAVQGQQQPLARIIRNIAFAKQRFDSTAGPVGKIALMLLPVATLLAYIASDRRHDRPQRDRADALLRKLDSKFCTAIGLSADWGIICTWFLRLFDVANHDIAKSRSEIDCMIETLDAVFLEGRVFQQLLVAPAAAAASGASGSTEPLPPRLQAAGQEFGFITGKVMRDLRHKYVFYASGYPVLLWGEPSAADKQELLHRLQNVASLTKERLRADFPLNDVRSALAIFDRRLVRKAFGPPGDSKVRTFLLRSVRHLSGVLGCDEAAAVLQYNSVIPYMTQSEPLAGVTNQQAWALLLDDDHWEKACPKRLRGASLALCRLIRFYISIEDGECTVERDLGEFRNQMREHRSADRTFHDDCLVVRLNGPRSAAEFDEGGDSRNNLTSFSRECASLWRELYGKRRGHFNAKAVSAASSKKQTARTFRGTMRGVLAAARLAVAARRRAKSSSSSSSVALHAGAGTADSALWNDPMTKFQSRSRKNIPGVTQTRAYPGGAFMNPAGVSLAPYRAAAAQPLARPRLINKVALLGVTGVRVRELAVVSGRHCCAEADLVIVPDISIFHDVPALTANEDLAISLLYIVLLGLEVATTTQLSASGGKPRSIPTASCQRHVPAMLQRMVFCLGARLVIEHPDVHRALRRVASAPKSKVTWSKCVGEPASGGNVVFNTLAEVVLWADSVRRVEHNLGVKAVLVA